MNPTIEKIIAHLFEDVEWTEETRAIYEEVRTNCQERYSDARERGLSEDEAIHVVIESLSGMEEMLKPYARQAQEDEDAEDGFSIRDENDSGAADSSYFDKNEEDTLDNYTFDPDHTPIREIRLSHMTDTDVTLSPSDDGLVHISWDEPGRTFSARVAGGALLIEPSPSGQETPDLRDASLNTLPEKLGRMLSGIFQSVSFSFGGGSLSVALPADLAPALCVGTASGNVEVRDLSLAQAHLSSASGDIRLAHAKVEGELRTTSASGDIQADDVCARELSLASSASGDIRLTRCAVVSQLHLKTTSGDITWEGSCPGAEITSISGDLHISDAFEALCFKTVSGDVMITISSPNLREVSGQTVSGDIRLRLPADLRACVNCHSFSGDVHQNFSSFADGEARVTLQTKSGDISVR